MNLNFKRGALIALGMGLAACSVYRSTGRKNFENKASQNGVTASSSENLDQICWRQSAAEALWDDDGIKEMIVKKISEDEIEVCATHLY